MVPAAGVLSALTLISVLRSLAASSVDNTTNCELLKDNYTTALN